MISPHLASQMLRLSEAQRETEYKSGVRPLFYLPSRAARSFARQQRLKLKERALEKRERALELRERQVETALRLFRETAFRNLPASL